MSPILLQEYWETASRLSSPPLHLSTPFNVNDARTLTTPVTQPLYSLAGNHLGAIAPTNLSLQMRTRNPEDVDW
jgi:hypothetical protein